MSVLPDLALVARHIRSRTKDDNGNYLGTFTSATNPDDATATSMIESAYDTDWSDELGVNAGADLPDALQAMIREAVALQSAVLIELSIYRDQIAQNPDAFRALVEERDRVAVKAATALADFRSGDQPGSQRQLAVSGGGFELPSSTMAPGDGYFLDVGDGQGARWVTTIFEPPATWWWRCR